MGKKKKQRRRRKKKGVENKNCPTHRYFQHCPRRMHQKPWLSAVVPESERERERELRDYHLPIRALVLVRQRPSAKRGRYRLEKCTLSYFTQERALCKLLRSSLRDDIMATMEQRWRVYVCVRGCRRRRGGGRDMHLTRDTHTHIHTYHRRIIRTYLLPLSPSFTSQHTYRAACIIQGIFLRITSPALNEGYIGVGGGEGERERDGSLARARAHRDPTN